MDNLNPELMVIGTAHQYHHGGYSLNHLRAILDAADPDVVCVEIRPVDFEKGNFHYYPMEMSEVGVKWANEKGQPCCPIDWWHEEDLTKKEAPTAEDLKNNPFQPLRWKSVRDPDWRNLNSMEFCHRCKEYHGIKGSIFDADPSSWKIRNMEMSVLIDGVVHQYPGKRIAVLTGFEHKYWFDEYFAGRLDVAVIQPTALSLSPDIGAPYTPESLLGVMGSYLKGPYVNLFPDALGVDGLLEDLEDVERSLPGDSCVYHMKGMYYYVIREYEKALSYLVQAADDPSMTIAFGPARIRPQGPISLLRCSQVCDLMGRREEALEFNKRALSVIPEDHPWSAVFRRRIERPFTRTGTPA